MTDTCCENCGKVVNDPIDQFGEGDWILCFSCDWEHQMDWKFNTTQGVIDSGQQTSFLSDEYQESLLNDAR